MLSLIKIIEAIHTLRSYKCMLSVKQLLCQTEWCGAGAVVCLERGADLHTAQMTPPPLTVSCFRKIQIGFTFLVPAHPGSPGQRAVKLEVEGN